jgi:hypothetical protein
MPVESGSFTLRAEEGSSRFGGLYISYLKMRFLFCLIFCFYCSKAKLYWLPVQPNQLILKLSFGLDQNFLARSLQGGQNPIIVTIPRPNFKLTFESRLLEQFFLMVVAINYLPFFFQALLLFSIESWSQSLPAIKIV